MYIEVRIDILPHLFVLRRGFHALYDLIFMRPNDGRQPGFAAFITAMQNEIVLFGEGFQTH